jgi:aromatic ring hydroxylase
MNKVALTYEMAQDREHKKVMTAKSALTGETINRFCHLHQSTDDLIDSAPACSACSGSAAAPASSAASGWMCSIRFCRISGDLPDFVWVYQARSWSGRN